MSKIHPSNQKITDVILSIAAVAAIALSVFQVWQGIVASLSAPVFRPVHVSWVLAIAFLVYPTFKSRHSVPVYLTGRVIDFVLVALTCWASTTIAMFDYDDISFLLDGLGSVEQAAGVVLIVMLLEATRRTVGLVMVVIAALFLAYAMFGDVLPDNVASKGFSVEEIVRFHIYSTNGVYGAPLAIAAGVVFMFVLFGAFLQVTGAGQFLSIWHLLWQVNIEVVRRKRVWLLQRLLAQFQDRQSQTP